MGASSTTPGLGASGPGDPQKGARIKIWTDRTQVAASVATALAVIVAIWVAGQGQVTVDHNSQVTLRQSEDAQLSTAITAIGSSDTAEEIAGLLLLARNTSNRFTLMGETEEPPADVYGDYTTALQILSGYLSSHGETFLADSGTQRSASFGRGYGVPPSPGVPLDIIYAANQIKFLLASDMQSNVAALKVAVRPALDLSNDELIGQPWTGVNFSWMSAYMVGIDLRGASLESSQWSTDSDLANSDLQCADLQDANFQGANLSNADLEGAYVQGADFRGANIKGAVFKQLYGAAKWSRHPPGIVTLSVHKWNPATCLRNSTFWRGQPASVSAPPSLSSPKPSSSPTPRSSVSNGKLL